MSGCFDATNTTPLSKWIDKVEERIKKLEEKVNNISYHLTNGSILMSSSNDCEVVNETKS